MNEETLNKLRTEADSWLGTPHIHKRAIKGLGVDCINLVVALYKHLGYLPQEFTLPNYKVSLGAHNPSNAMSEQLLASGLVEEVKDIQNGDILVFKTGGGYSAHIGIVIDNYLYHSFINHGVIKSPLNHWTKRVDKIFRLK